MRDGLKTSCWDEFMNAYSYMCLHWQEWTILNISKFWILDRVLVYIWQILIQDQISLFHIATSEEYRQIKNPPQHGKQCLGILAFHSQTKPKSSLSCRIFQYFDVIVYHNNPDIVAFSMQDWRNNLWLMDDSDISLNGISIGISRGQKPGEILW